MALLIWNSAKPQIPYPWAGVFENSNLKKKMTYMYNTCIRPVSLYLLYNAIKCQEIELATLVFFFLHDFRHQSHCMHRHVQYPWTSSYIPWWTLGLNQIVRIDLYIRVIFASQSVFVIFHLNKLNMETGNINGRTKTVASINKVNVSHIKIL